MTGTKAMKVEVAWSIWNFDQTYEKGGCMRILKLIFLMLIAVITVSCGDDNDITNNYQTPDQLISEDGLIGTWTGPIDGTEGPDTLTMVLYSNGAMTAFGETEAYYLVTGTWSVPNSQFTGEASDPSGEFIVQFSGTISGDSISGTWTTNSVDGGSGTFSVTKQTQTTARVNPGCFLVRFSNDRYYQEMHVADPNRIVSHIDISGDNVTTEKMTFGLYEDKPTDWWTDPNIFISSGSEPAYPLHHTMIVHYKDGTSEVFNFTTTTFEEAT